MEKKPIYCSQCGQQRGYGQYGYSACSEHEAVQAYIAYNNLKNTGALQRLESDKALAEQIKCGDA